MTIVLDSAVMVGIAMVVGGFIIALARQVSTLTADVAMLVAAIATERAERQASIHDEHVSVASAIDRIYDRLGATKEVHL